jgi:hypothetical protein
MIFDAQNQRSSPRSPLSAVIAGSSENQNQSRVGKAKRIAAQRESHKKNAWGLGRILSYADRRLSGDILA